MRGARRVGGHAGQPLDLLGVAIGLLAMRGHRVRERIEDGGPLWGLVAARGGPTGRGVATALAPSLGDRRDTDRPARARGGRRGVCPTRACRDRACGLRRLGVRRGRRGSGGVALARRYGRADAAGGWPVAAGGVTWWRGRQ